MDSDEGRVVTSVLLGDGWDVRERTEFPSLCEVCEISKVFGTLAERTAFENEHQHPGVD